MDQTVFHPALKIYTAGEGGGGGGLLLSRALKFGLVATRIRI